MRAISAVLMLVLVLAGLAPASAGELFRRGPVVCTARSPSVTALAVGECNVKKAPGGGYYSGSCDGRLSTGGGAIPFTVFGEAKRMDHVFPDNDTPLTFDYRGLSCAVVSSRLKTVRNCRSSGGGLRKQCEVCVITGAKVCFNVTFGVTIKAKGKGAAAH